MQVNTTWMINAYVGKKSYGCNVLKEKLNILNVYYVTPKEAKSILQTPLILWEHFPKLCLCAE